MLSRRLPADLSPNPWAARLAALRERNVRLVDLTESNPTRTGLSRLSGTARAALSGQGVERYEPDPRGVREAREAVAALFEGIDPDAIVLTASTSEAYAHLFRLLGNPGDSFLVPTPSYPLFDPIGAVEAVRVVPYPLGWDGAWHLDLDALERALTPEARAVIVVQPNHPTGSCLDGSEIDALEALCDRRGLAIVSDEVFRDHPWPPTTRTLPSLAGRSRVPTFTLGGLSKTCGLPQMKLAWIVVSGPEPDRGAALRGLEWLADLFLSVSAPVQRALPRLLAERNDFLVAARDRIGRNLDVLRDAERRSGAIGVQPAVGGWSAVLRLPSHQDDETWALELLEAGVVVHPGHFYDLPGGPFVVLSLIVPPEEMKEGISRMEAVVHRTPSGLSERGR